MTVSSGNIIDGVCFRRFGELCFFQKFLTINQNCISLFCCIRIPLFIRRTEVCVILDVT